MVFIFGLASCSSPDPTHSEIFYTFRTNEGDLFETNSDYLIENLYGENEDGYRREFVHLGMFDSVNYFRIHSWPSSPIFVDYGTGEIDTLTVTYGPSGHNPLSKFSKIEFIQWKLNGSVITEWDFNKNPGLRDSVLSEFGVAIYPDQSFYPIPVVIPK